MIKLIKSTFHNESQTKQELIDFIARAEVLSFGPECQRFESMFASWQQRAHCVFVNSGSSANLAVVQAMLNLGRLKRGDKVGVSALTWSTNVMPILQLGLEAVPIDVELDTLNVSSNKLAEAVDAHDLKALFITNLLGFCDDLDVIKSLCQDKNIVLLEDNCESLGTVYKGEKLGNYGLASTFSFYVGHHMSTIEGGAVCTDDDELAQMLRLVRAHGWDRNLAEAQQKALRDQHNVNSSFYSRYTFYDLGYNLRPSEINGFIGTTQVQYLEEIISTREKTFKTIAEVIYAQSERFYPIRYDHLDVVSNFAVPIICRSKDIRDELVARCDGKIELRPVVGGDMTKQPFYHKYQSSELVDSNAGLIHEQGLYFGNNPELSEDEIQTIITTFSE